MKQITIFTPTYNRVNTLERLYMSLINQTSKNFVWLIIDDGSIDNTCIMVKSWIDEKKIQIEYHKQSNQGKSAAHNVGVKLTSTELFTCVDSDDYLASTAVEEIIKFWDDQKSEKFTGVLAFKKHHDKTPITKMKNENITSSTLLNAYRRHGLTGDTMLIYKTAIIKKHSFPLFKDEKFVPEAYLYDRIDQEGELLIYKKALYFCEYLQDGYSKNMSNLIKNNPNGYLSWIEQRLSIDSKIGDKFLDSVRYSAICIYMNKTNYIRNGVYPIITLISLPFSYLLYYFRYKK